MNVDELGNIFPKIWCRESSAFAETWTPENPAWGQCFPTSRIAQSELGGSIIMVQLVEIRGIHFYNRLPDGQEVDFTSRQFTHPVQYKNHHLMSASEPDEYDAAFPAIKVRYDILRQRFNEYLTEQY